MPKCDYPYCGREEHRDGKCIFHLPKKTSEEAKLFKARLLKEQKKSEDDPRIPNVNFSGFVFPEGFNFPENIEFRKPVDFEGATFEGDVSFNKPRFSGAAVFDEATFSGYAEFEDATFSGNAGFNRAKFSGNAGFGEVKFSHAGFNEATFSGGALFIGAKFSGNAGFREATFTRFAWFSNAKFSGYAYFGEVKFSGDAEFEDTTFSGVAEFDGATFSGNVHFKRAVFLEGLSMGARFGGLGIFERTVFQYDRAELDDLTRLVRGEGSLKLAWTRFDGAIVEQNAEVRFIQPKELENGKMVNYAIGRVSFLNVDLERFNFQDVEWGTYRGRRAVIEEVMMGKPPFVDVTPEKIRQIYARLRQNLEAAQLYAEAGDFFIGEMEMKRIGIARDLPGDQKSRRVRNWLRRNVSAIGLYRLLSLYGERWRRVLLWIIVSIPLFGLAQTLIYPSMADPSLPQFLYAFWENIKRSAFVFFQFRTDNHLDIIERLWSGLLLGLTYIALRRQLERHHTA